MGPEHPASKFRSNASHASGYNGGMKEEHSNKAGGLPPSGGRLFWDCRETAVSLEAHGPFVIGRVLSHGGWEDVRWLRRAAGDDAIRRFLRESRGRGLERPQLRYWQLILDLPEAEVDAWLAMPGRAVWDAR